MSANTYNQDQTLQEPNAPAPRLSCDHRLLDVATRTSLAMTQFAPKAATLAKLTRYDDHNEAKTLPVSNLF